MTELETTLAALKDAIAVHDALKTRLPGAEASLAEAAAHRQSLVVQSTRGAEIADKTMKAAGLNLGAAEDSLALLREQITVAQADVEVAKAAFTEAELEVNQHNLAVAIRHRITCADALMQAGRDLATAEAAYRDSAEPIYTAMRSVGRIPSEYEKNGMREREHNGAQAVPADIQQVIVQRATVICRDLSRIERALWGNSAAPDAVADAPHVAAREAEAKVIGQAQALEAAGREAQAKAAPAGAPSWKPEPQMLHGAKPFQFMRLGATIREI